MIAGGTATITLTPSLNGTEAVKVTVEGVSAEPVRPPVAFAAGAPMGTPFWAAPELDVGLPHDQ